MVSLVDKSDNFKSFRGMQPAADNLGKKVLSYVYGKMVTDYVGFLKNAQVSEAVEYIGSLVEEKGLVRGSVSDRPFFVTDSDMGINGSRGRAYALVKPGKKNKPLRIIFAHTDVPCLKVLQQPIHIESDADKCLVYPSVALATEPYGGIRAEDWYGREVEVVGSIFKDGLEKKIRLPGRIKQMSVHVDDEENKGLTNLNVDIGFRKMKEVYAALGIDGSMDFGRAELYVLPFLSGGNGRLVGNELGAYGHDDRACLWTATVAGLEAILKDSTDNTCLIFGLDREEVGSTGGSGGYRGFFEAVLRDTLKVVNPDGKYNLPLDLRRSLLGGAPAISADVDVALGEQEILKIDEGMIDLQNSSKSGWGAFVASGGSRFGLRSVSPKHIDFLMTAFEKNFNGRNKKDRYQIVGDCTTPDSEFLGGTLADEFDKFMPCVDVGVPVIGLHDPTSESVNIFDLYWTLQAYSAYLNS